MKRALSFLASIAFVSTAALADEAPKTEPAKVEPAKTEASISTTPAPAATDAKPAETKPEAKAEPVYPEVGKEAPEFKLPSQDGSDVKLEDYKGHWVVLYFYPKDFTGGCTLEAQNFQKDLGKFKAKDTVVLGVSVDSVSSHKGFCTKESLQFKLLSDADHKVSEKYGTLIDYKGTKFANRITFVIDPEGKIAKVYPKVNPAMHSGEVLADLDVLKKGSKG